MKKHERRVSEQARDDVDEALLIRVRPAGFLDYHRALGALGAL
jgi:hypothetical protein